MPISRREARDLMSRGYETGATVINGRVTRRADGVWMIDDTPIDHWLSAVEGQEIVIIGADIAEGPGLKRTCPVCGNEYEGHECPRCRQVRQRLRGRG